MTKQESNSREIKDSPEFFVNDFAALGTALKEKAGTLRLMNHRFNDIQRAQTVGIIMALSATVRVFQNNLKDWGYTA